MSVVEGFDTMRNGFLPRWDRAYSALIEDLDQRGLLDSTMVLAWGEFGRTPKVNEKAGRDHWPNVFSAAIAGGGIQGGRVIGSSDDKGGEPAFWDSTPARRPSRLRNRSRVRLEFRLRRWPR